MQVHQTEIAKGKQMKNAKNNVLYLLGDMTSEDDFNLGIASFASAIRISGSALEQEKPARFNKGNHKGHCKKTRFRDLDEAIEVLHRIQRYRGYAEEAGRTLTHRNEQRAYKCPICRGAHLTSKPAFGEVAENAAA
jgi:predicted  nucleic acid-binding Zn ribbon protein